MQNIPGDFLEADMPKPSGGNQDAVQLTVVIPVFNEEAVVGQMHGRLAAVMTLLGLRHEILFVDDGSTDRTPRVIQEISGTDASVAGIFLSGHYGKESALAAGLKQARGEAVVIMDGDLQDPPELIPQMLRAWRNGAGVVRMCPRAAWAGGADFMLYSRKAVSVLSLVVSRKRHMKKVFHWAGLSVVALPCTRQSRAAGGSKWNVAAFAGQCLKTVRAAVTGYMPKPQYIIKSICRAGRMHAHISSPSAAATPRAAEPFAAPKDLAPAPMGPARRAIHS